MIFEEQKSDRGCQTVDVAIQERFTHFFLVMLHMGFVQYTFHYPLSFLTRLFFPPWCTGLFYTLLHFAVPCFLRAPLGRVKIELGGGFCKAGGPRKPEGRKKFFWPSGFE